MIGAYAETIDLGEEEGSQGYELGTGSSTVPRGITGISHNHPYLGTVGSDVFSDKCKVNIEGRIKVEIGRVIYNIALWTGP